MILGVGTDIVDVDKLRRLRVKWGDKLLKKILTDKEKKYCLGHKNATLRVAARFAAKESVVKALGGVSCRRFDFKDIEIVNADSGKPHVVFHREIKEEVEALNVKTHVSISHTGNHATGFAVIEKNE